MPDRRPNRELVCLYVKFEYKINDIKELLESASHLCFLLTLW